LPWERTTAGTPFTLETAMLLPFASRDFTVRVGLLVRLMAWLNSGLTA
jgi:hypothetical protein